MTPDDLRALAGALSGERIAGMLDAEEAHVCEDAAGYLRAQADDAYSRGYSGTATAHPATVYVKMLAAAPATPQPCWCHKCNEGRLVNGIPFAATQMIVCPICGNKRCPHASDHALACTASNDPIAVPAAPQAEPKEE